MKLWLVLSLLVLSLVSRAAMAQDDGDPNQTATTPTVLDFLESRHNELAHKVDDLARSLRDLEAKIPSELEQQRRDARELLREELEEQERAIAARLQSMDRTLDAQDDRIADVAAWGGIDAGRSGVIATAFGGLITIVVVFFTFRSASTARAEARQAADTELRNSRVQLDTILVQAKETLSRSLQEGQQRLEESTTAFQERIDDAVSCYDRLIYNFASDPEVDIRELVKRARTLRQREVDRATKRDTPDLSNTPSPTAPPTASPSE